VRLQGRCENPPREALMQNMDGGRSQKSSIYTMIAKQQKSEGMKSAGTSRELFKTPMQKTSYENWPVKNACAAIDTFLLILNNSGPM